MARCEDYPCCGHTDGLGCDYTPDYSAIQAHLGCEHEAGYCQMDDNEPTCDVCGGEQEAANDEGAGWCEHCGCCADHCQKQIDCNVEVLT